MYHNEFSQEFEQSLGQEMESGGAAYETFEFNPEYLGEAPAQAEFEGEGEFEMSGELHETLEMELAHELLEVSNELELNQFLGGLLKKVGGAVGKLARSPIGRSLSGALRAVAKRALPLAGGALGTFVGGPVGTALGSKLGATASNLFELELEGLSPEDQEFETARAYVRFASSAARRAATLQQQRSLPPQALVRRALAGAAMQHAPGLLRPRNANGTFRATRPRPGYGPAPQPRRYAPGSLNLGYQATTYADNGYDPDESDGYDDPDEPQQESYPPRRPARGTWYRRGRTLVIQL